MEPVRNVLFRRWMVEGDESFSRLAVVLLGGGSTARGLPLERITTTRSVLVV
jgi:hypothetical protein